MKKIDTRIRVFIMCMWSLGELSLVLWSVRFGLILVLCLIFLVRKNIIQRSWKLRYQGPSLVKMI